MNAKRELHDSSQNKMRVLVVNVRPAVRQHLVQLINEQSNFVVCAEAKDTNQALGALEKHQVDLAIVDISMERTNGMALTEKIKSQHPNLPVLAIPVREFLNQ